MLWPCLTALARQDFRGTLEVILAWNGAEPDEAVARERWPFELIVLHAGEANIARAKNAALDVATGEWIVFLNDDVRPEPDFLRAHLAAHAALRAPAMVLGSSPWVTSGDDTVFDRLIYETSMIFFYDGLTPNAWHGFRNAWNLNLSMPHSLLADQRFDERLGPFFFEDIELAWRLETGANVRVWYEPAAMGRHAHRYSLEGYLSREHALGQAAVRLWNANPACFRAVYGAALDEAYVTFCRQFVMADGRMEARLRAWFEGVVAAPVATLPADDRARRDWLTGLYYAHLPLKRLAFRRGLLAGVEQPAAPPADRGAGANPSRRVHAGGCGRSCQIAGA